MSWLIEVTQKKAMEALDITKKALTERNTNIWFFVEGTRNHGKNMLPFKKGAFVTAINAGVPIVPVVTSPYLKGFSLNNKTNGEAIIEVLPPIETKDLTKDDLEDLMLSCRLDMMETLNRLEEEAGK